MVCLHACADSGTLRRLPCNDDDDCADGICEGGVCVSDPDVEPVGDTAEDVAEDLTEIRVDPITEDEQPSVLGGLGDACVSDEECESGYCIDSDGGRICTELCSDECPEGYTCRLFINSGGDAVRICVPHEDVLCEPCSNHTECGGYQAFCVEQDNGDFCASDCSATRECPGGYFCNPVTIRGAGAGGEDLDTRVCEPATGICEPIELTSSHFTATSATINSSSFSLLGRVLSTPHELESESFALTGGF